MAKEKVRQKKMTVRVDFTPMVDMNMLLITFFMLCTTMIKSQTLQISLPSNDKVEQKDQNKVKQSEAITFILDSDREAPTTDKLTGQPVKGKVKKDLIYYYEGQADIAADASGALTNNKLKVTEFDPGTAEEPAGIRKILMERNKEVVKQIAELKEHWRNKEMTDEQYQDRAREIRNDSTLTRPVVIIKATPDASYENLISVLDEMQINSISRYQIDRMTAVDSAMVLDYVAKHGGHK
jgi:biopolymer transport protein ExbD